MKFSDVMQTGSGGQKLHNLAVRQMFPCFSIEKRGTMMSFQDTHFIS